MDNVEAGPSRKKRKYPVVLKEKKGPPCKKKKAHLLTSKVQKKIFRKIAKDIEEDEWKNLGRELGLQTNCLDRLEKDQIIHKSGSEERNFRMLQKWKQKKNPTGEEMVKLLSDALIKIERNDIADSISKIIGKRNEQQQRKIDEILQKITKREKRIWKFVKLPQAPWTDKILSLEELYVDLEMETTHEDHEHSERIVLKDLFGDVDGEEPLRILIEGGPGIGKTTLCSKLLNDWGRNRKYLDEKFKMVFLLELRTFNENDSLEEMLTQACNEDGISADDAFECIKAFENETLLILDGFDEVSDKCREKFFPLLEKKKYESMFVVVTSRTGMFQVKEDDRKENSGFIRKKDKQEQFWDKKILITGISKEKMEQFLQKYLKTDFTKSEMKIISMTKGEIREVFRCPLFLILIAMVVEDEAVDVKSIYSKTSVYKVFFNFIIRTNLFRENKLEATEDIDIFNESSTDRVINTLDKFGHLALQYLCENKLSFKETDILKYCKDPIILKLGILMKEIKFQQHRKSEFYKPVHKSFLEFVAAFAMWKLLKRDEDEFKEKLVRMAEEGLRPTNDSLFYVFLGGLMNSRAHILFQCLTPYALYFNIQSICFTNILLEIQDFDIFYPWFEKLLEPFIPSIYHINGNKGLTRQYFQHSAHAKILKYVSDREKINVLLLDSNFDFNFTNQLYFNQICLHLSHEIVKDLEKENRNSIKCKNLICTFSEIFQEENWKYFVSLLNSIESETFNFLLDDAKHKSSILSLMYKEMIKGQWKLKKIDRLIINLHDLDHPRSLSLLVDLVKENRIKQGVYLWINESEERTEDDFNQMKRKIEDLFNAVTESKSIQEFVVYNYNSNFIPQFDFHRENKMKWKTFKFLGNFICLNSSEKKKEKYLVEELIVDSLDDEMNLNLIRNMEGIKWLFCRLICFFSLVRMKWSGLEEIEELDLIKVEEKLPAVNPRIFSQLTNLQVLSLNVGLIKPLPRDSRDSFVNLFSSLQLRICELYSIPSVEMFSYFTEVLKEGLEKKEKKKISNVGGNEPMMKSREGNKAQLEELVIDFINGVRVELSQLKNCEGIEWIRSMLQDKILVQCCWLNMDLNIKQEEFLSLFPLKKFRVSEEVDGMNPNSSRRSQFYYRWFIILEKFCVRVVDD